MHSQQSLIMILIRPFHVINVSKVVLTIALIEQLDGSISSTQDQVSQHLFVVHKEIVTALEDVQAMRMMIERTICVQLIQQKVPPVTFLREMEITILCWIKMEKH